MVRGISTLQQSLLIGLMAGAFLVACGSDDDGGQIDAGGETTTTLDPSSPETGSSTDPTTTESSTTDPTTTDSSTTDPTTTDSSTTDPTTTDSSTTDPTTTDSSTTDPTTAPVQYQTINLVDFTGRPKALTNGETARFGWNNWEPGNVLLDSTSTEGAEVTASITSDPQGLCSINNERLTIDPKDEVGIECTFRLTAAATADYAATSASVVLRTTAEIQQWTIVERPPNGGCYEKGDLIGTITVEATAASGPLDNVRAYRTGNQRVTATPTVLEDRRISWSVTVDNDVDQFNTGASGVYITLDENGTGIYDPSEDTFFSWDIQETCP